MPHDDTTPTLSVVGEALDNPEPAFDPGPQPDDGPSDPPPDGPANDWVSGEIFGGSPVTPLGMMGNYAVFLDGLNQIQEVKELSANAISQLFGGRTDLLTSAFPKRNKDGFIVAWDQPKTRDRMFQACAEKGIWKSHERLRGIGAWPTDDGDVILHCGDRIIRRADDGSEEELLPGEIGSHVYPADAPAPTPAAKNASDHEGRGAAEELLKVLQSWNWSRPAIEPHLLLGWITGAMFSGALDWRPMAWLTGGKGTGKSTLQSLISGVMGGESGLLTASDASEAGIRSVIQCSTLPVALDELEAEADNRKAQGVIKLARQASSGGLVLRGSADHKGAEFRVRSAFLFGSILIPPLMDQDVSRIAVLELRNFQGGEVAPRIDRRHWRRLGRLIRRRIFDSWDRLHETLETYRHHLTTTGHTARSADQYGTLLAMADLALFGSAPTRGEDAKAWASKLDAEIFAALTDEAHGWERMLSHLLSQPLDAFRSGKRFSVGEMLAAACDLPGSIESFGPKEAQEELRRAGIGIEGKGTSARVVLANNHTGLARFFEGTRWADGVHRQDAKRIPSSETPKAARRFAMVASRATVFPIKSIPAFVADVEARASEPADGQPF